MLSIYEVIYSQAPDYGSQFHVATIQNCWGEQRVTYYDVIGSIRSIPITWTDKMPFDPFLEVSAPTIILNLKQTAVAVLTDMLLKIVKEETVC